LAVGDLGFKLKCFKTIDTILPKTAIIFVSHQMPMISRICDKIILMDKGKSVIQGEDVGKAIDMYYTHFADNDQNIVFDDGSVELEQVEIPDATYLEGIPQVTWGETLKLKFRFSIKRPMNVPFFGINIMDKEQRPVAVLKRNPENSDLEIKDGVLEFTVIHKHLQLSKGLYSINISVSEFVRKNPVLRINSILSFQVNYEEETWPPFLLKSEYRALNVSVQSKNQSTTEY